MLMDKLIVNLFSTRDLMVFAMFCFSSVKSQAHTGEFVEQNNFAAKIASRAADFFNVINFINLETTK